MLFTGSCFSDHIAQKLGQHRFHVLSQPNGVVFNPVSIAQHLQRINAGRFYTADDLQQFNESWHSWFHHGSFSGVSRNEVLTHMNQTLEQGHRFLNSADSVLVITLGTAFVYSLADNPEFIVANCHKYPAKHFVKRLLQVNEIVTVFSELLEHLSHLQVVFTVSPVRHVRDGLVQNNLSKAVLLQAVHELVANNAHTYYFPAYEIVTDELRDYRFYEKDLVHPSELAAEYVWEQFLATCFDQETQTFAAEMKKLRLMQDHRIMQKGTTAHASFERSLAETMDALKKKYPQAAW